MRNTNQDAIDRDMAEQAAVSIRTMSYGQLMAVASAIDDRRHQCTRPTDEVDMLAWSLFQWAKEYDPCSTSTTNSTEETTDYVTPCPSSHGGEQAVGDAIGIAT